MGDEQIINGATKVVREGGGTALVFSPQASETLVGEILAFIDWLVKLDASEGEKALLLAELQRPKPATGHEIAAALNAGVEEGMPTEPAPDLEPVFTIRAQDVLAVPALVKYKRLAESYKLFDHAAQVDLAILEMTRWQDSNSDRVKNPDHEHGTPVAGRPPYVEDVNRETALNADGADPEEF